MNATTRQRIDWAAFGLVALALVLRLVYVLKVAPGAFHNDQEDYLEAARRLLDGRPMAFRNYHLFVRPPGFSLFVAAIWKLTGTRSLMAIKVAQAFVGTASCWYVGQLTTLLTPRRLARLAAIAGAAVYPYFLYYTALCGTETLTIFFVVAGTYHLAAGLGDPPVMKQVWLGSLLLALGNLVRAHVTVLWPLVGLWVLWRYWPRLRVVVTIGVAMAVPLVLVSLPWTIAVARQGLGVMFVTDGSGIYYYMGHNDATEQLYCEHLDVAQERALVDYGTRLASEPAYVAARAAPPGQQSATFWRAGLAWDRAHAGKLPCLMTSKLWGYWRPYVNPATYGRATVLVSLVALPIIVLAVLGMLWAWRAQERPLTSLVLLEILAGTASAVIFSTEIRYRIQAIDTFLIAYAAYACSEWWARRQR